MKIKNKIKNILPLFISVVGLLSPTQPSTTIYGMNGEALINVHGDCSVRDLFELVNQQQELNKIVPSICLESQGQLFKYSSLNSQTVIPAGSDLQAIFANQQKFTLRIHPDYTKCITFYGNFHEISREELKDFDTLEEFINSWATDAFVWNLFVENEDAVNIYRAISKYIDWIECGYSGATDLFSLLFRLPLVWVDNRQSKEAYNKQDPILIRANHVWLNVS